MTHVSCKDIRSIKGKIQWRNPWIITYVVGMNDWRRTRAVVLGSFSCSVTNVSRGLVA